MCHLCDVQYSLLHQPSNAPMCACCESRPQHFFFERLLIPPPDEMWTAAAATHGECLTMSELRFRASHHRFTVAVKADAAV